MVRRADHHKELPVYENYAISRINLNLAPQLNDLLQAEAEAAGVKPAEVIREALRRHLAGKPPRRSCLDIARQVGVVGIYKDGPSDLSTNKEHFEGFGVD